MAQSFPALRVRIRTLLFVVAAVALAAQAGCKKSYPAPQHVAGDSESIPAVVGTGVTWHYGDFPYSPTQFAGDLFDQINLYRTSRGLPAMKWHDGMALVAQVHASDMFTRKYLALASPEGITMATRMVSSVPAMNFDRLYQFVANGLTPTQIFNQLLAGPSSRAVLDDGSVTHFGASFQQNPGPYYVAMLFGVNVRP